MLRDLGVVVIVPKRTSQPLACEQAAEGRLHTRRATRAEGATSYARTTVVFHAYDIAGRFPKRHSDTRTPMP
eukprot:5283923-Pleurochrysis_carterae.AAC.1